MEKARGPGSQGHGLRALSVALLPGAPVVARVVPLAELSAGGALVCGFQIRLAAGLALGMILNFHFAAGVIFHYKYLTNGYGLPVLGGLLALALGGAGLPWRARAPWKPRAEGD